MKRKSKSGMHAKVVTQMREAIKSKSMFWNFIYKLFFPLQNEKIYIDFRLTFTKAARLRNDQYI